MTSFSSRISEDVWSKAGEVAQRMGLPNERTAIEAVFRVFADAYATGQAPAKPVAIAKSAPSTPAESAPSTPAESAPIDCAAALDGLLSA